MPLKPSVKGFFIFLIYLQIENLSVRLKLEKHYKNKVF